MFHSSFNTRTSDERYALLITFPDGSLHSFQVGDSAITIGRSPATAIRVCEDGVSRQHCVISRAGGRLAILDQGSTNGTYVNGALVRQARLGDGDVVQVGSARIKVKATTDDDDTPSPRPETPLPGDEDDDIQTQTHRMTAQPHIQQRLAERLARSDGAASAGELVLGAVFEAFPVDRAFILTRRRDHSGVVPEVLASKTRLPNEDATGELDMSIPETVLSTLINDSQLTTATDATAAVRAALTDRVSSPIMCAPLRQGGDCFGALYLDALTLPEWAQGEEMLGFLSSLGSLAALAISRARLQAELNVEHRLSKLRQSQLSRRDSEEEPAQDGGSAGGEHVSARRVRRLAATVTRGLLQEVTGLVGALNDDLTGVARTIGDNTSGGDDHGAEEAGLLEATARAGRIIAAAEDVATMAELSAGTLDISVAAVDVASVVESAKQRHHAKAVAGDVELALGPVEDGLTALADRQLLRRTLDHLLRHAIERAGRGGRVVLSAKLHAAHAEFVVADSGPAVPEDRVADYFSADPADDAVGGGGVWLYYCRIAAEAQSGTIAVTGLAGNNRITVSLPADEQ